MRFVDPQNDVAFKKIFGSEEHKEILISFLNAVLDLQGDKEIEDVELLNPYQAPKLQGLKFTLLDVRARDKRGVTFIVEMQVESVAGFKKREDELTTLLDKWVYFLKHATQLTEVPAHTDNPGLHSAYAVAERFRWSEEELEVYDYWSMKAQDERGALTVAEQRGEQRGRQETAQAMLADGLPVAMITQYTGLSAEQLQSLRTPQSAE